MKINNLIILIALSISSTTYSMNKKPSDIFPKDIWFEILDLGVNKHGKNPAEIFSSLYNLNATSKEMHETIQQYVKLVCQINKIENCTYNKFKTLILDKIFKEFDEEIEKRVSKIQVKRTQVFLTALNLLQMQDEKIDEKIKIADKLKATYWITKKMNDDNIIVLLALSELTSDMLPFELALKHGVDVNKKIQTDKMNSMYKDKTLLDIEINLELSALDSLEEKLNNYPFEEVFYLLLKYGAKPSDKNIKDLEDIRNKVIKESGYVKYYTGYAPRYIKTLDRIIKAIKAAKK